MNRSRRTKLLATQENPTAGSIIDEVRGTEVGVEPTPVVAAPLHTEDAKAVARVGNGPHPNEEPFASRLILILQTQLGADFAEAKVKAKIVRAVIDVFAIGTALETKIGNGSDKQIDFLCFEAHCEGGLAEDAV